MAGKILIDAGLNEEWNILPRFQQYRRRRRAPPCERPFPPHRSLLRPIGTSAYLTHPSHHRRMFAPGASVAFGLRPQCGANRLFIGPISKGCSGSTAADPGAYDLGRSLNGGGRRSMRAARWQGCTAQGSKVLAIFLSLLPKSCYGASFGQKRPPGGGVFNEAGMFDRTTVGRARGGAQAGESGHKEKMALGVRASP